MNIQLTDLLDLLTYNKLFNYVDLPSPIAASIVLDDPEHKICFVEPYCIEASTVWYPITSWYDECKRRKQQDDISAEHHKTYKSPEPKDFNAALLAAALSGDKKAILKLLK